MQLPKTLLVFLFLLLTSCGGGSDGETDTGGGSGETGTTATGEAPEPTMEDDSVPFNVAGTWTDTDVVGVNSCGLSEPAAGSSRVTPGIVIEQDGNRITLTAPPNILGTRTVARGTMALDGTMILTGSDGGATIRLDLRAVSDDLINGTSQVVADGCNYNFSNSLVRSG